MGNYGILVLNKESIASGLRTVSEPYQGRNTVPSWGVHLEF